MAFLDNSGDIILDAVLTDLGRKRLAEGNFRITQFALGDDEIDYGLYDKDHPSGSAYYDLEILQTPVFEAFTQTNANINYGLISLASTNILYMPSLKLNDKTSVGNNRILSGGVAYVAANDSDWTQLETYLTGAQKIMNSEIRTNYYLFESGLNSTDGVPDRTQSNRDTYLVSTGLVDASYQVSFDSRFISGIYTISGSSNFEYQVDGSPMINIPISTSIAATTNRTTSLENYVISSSPAFDNLVFKQSSDEDLNISVINGPRASVTAFSLEIHPDMKGNSSTSPAKYSLYGQTQEDLFGTGVLYDYLDTMIYIMGSTTGVTAQLPARIIRKVGS